MTTTPWRIPKTKHGHKTFDHIIACGKKLFSSKGFQATSVNDIIAEAGVAAGTFYIYFNDKLALYTYILNDYKKKIRDTIHHDTKHCLTRRDLEREGLKSFIRFAYQDNLAYNIIWESLFIDKSIFQDYYENFAQRYVEGLKKSHAQGEVRDVDFETLSWMLMGIANFVGLQVLFRVHVTEEELDRVADSVLDILEHGMFQRPIGN
jgi:AcrR family transcriptional regulator